MINTHSLSVSVPLTFPMNLIAQNVISGELRILDNHQFECKQIKKDISAGEEDDQK